MVQCLQYHFRTSLGIWNSRLESRFTNCQLLVSPPLHPRFVANGRFVGTWSTLSKLVVCAVMIRGRHRGLPVAIDRAVMLPRDFTAAEEQALEETFSRRLSRMSSNLEQDINRIHSRRESRDTMPHRSGTGTSFQNDRPSFQNDRPSFQNDRPSTPPNQIRSSISKSINTTTTHSPRALSFSLPSKPSFERSPVMRSTMGMGAGTGALTPVKENMLSRNVSRAEGDVSPKMVGDEVV
jgi:hypothetical protein